MAIPKFSRRAIALGGVGAAAALSLRVLLKPRQSSDAPLLDWPTVRHIAHERSRESGMHSDYSHLSAECDQHARELAPLMAEVFGHQPKHFPAFSVIDRRRFVDQNLEIVKRMIGPVEELRRKIPESRLAAWSRVAVSRYVGETMGFMSQRVLGQYDPVLMLGPVSEAPATSLFLVEPNIAAYRQKHHVNDTSLRRWLILHELTHAWQFEEHPWVKDYITTLISEMMMSGMVKDLAGPGKLPPSREMIRLLPGTLRTQLSGFAKVQAVMSLLEGYSNFVMNQVGRKHLKDFEQLEKSFHQRRTERSFLERLVLSVTGMKIKLRQYEIGEKFCDAVAKDRGKEFLNRVWTEPMMLPSLSELQRPKLWIARVS